VRPRQTWRHTHGGSLRASAAAFGVCEKTLRRWLARARPAGFPRRLEDHSSRPRCQPRRTTAELETQILALRRDHRTYAQIRTVLPHLSLATLSRIQALHAGARIALRAIAGGAHGRPGEAAELLDVEVEEVAGMEVFVAEERRFGRLEVGEALEAVTAQDVAIDDHSRLGFACLLPDERTLSVLAALRQAVAFYHEHAIPIRRVLTDRGSTYRSKLFAQTCRELRLKHSFTRPYRPQTNGKAERFLQTFAREWAYARSYDSSAERATYLTPFLHDYNFHRPHVALHHLPPASRLPLSADNVHCDSGTVAYPVSNRLHRTFRVALVSDNLPPLHIFTEEIACTTLFFCRTPENQPSQTICSSSPVTASSLRATA